MSIIVGAMLVGLVLFIGPFVLDIGGLVATAVVLIGGVVALVSYLLLCNEVVLHVARRLRATSISGDRQETLLLLSWVVIGIVSFALFSIWIVTQGGH